MPERPIKERWTGFGLSTAIPESASVAWGARLIFPDDLLGDRTGSLGSDENPELWQVLITWLNGTPTSRGALSKALAAARRMASRDEIEPNTRDRVTLYEDERGIIVGNPNASYGYLYIAAWLKEGA